MTNVAYIGMPKFISPFGDKEVYLVPGVKEQQGSGFNYIVVCCSPSYNGLYRCPVSEYKNFKTGVNNKKKCYYVPISKCELVKPLNEIQMEPVRKNVRKIQLSGFEKSGRKNRPK